MLGTLAGERRTQLNELPWWLRSPLHAASWRVPALAYACLVFVVIATLPLAFLSALAWARPERDRGTPLLLTMMLSGTVAYALLTTVFGDGLSEASRHFLPGHLAAIAAIVAFVIGVPSVVAQWWTEPKANGFPIGAGLVAVVVTLLVTVLAVRWARDQPLSLGMLDEPAGRKVAPGAGLTLRGWAIDPFGVDSVIVDLAGVATPLRPALDSYALKQVFPGYPDSAHASFSLELSSADLARASTAGPPTLRILVKSRTGATTQVDRRRLEIAP